MSNKLHVKKGDTVVIISGDDRGNKGKVLDVSPKEGKVIVEGRNMVKKHVKPRKMGDPGGIVKAEGALYASKDELRARMDEEPAANGTKKVLEILEQNAKRG